MKLTGSEASQFTKALLSAFPTSEALSKMVRTELDENVHAIAGGSNLGAIVFNLVQWAEARGWAQRLYDAARASNPGNSALANLTFFTQTTTHTTVEVHITQETPMLDFRDRPIHASHKKGLYALIRDALNTTDDNALKVFNRLFEDDVTYQELPNLAESTLTRAIDKCLGDHDIKETRITELVLAIQGVVPARRYCEVCNRLDLTRKAGRWSPVDQPTCLIDQGMYVAVAFPTPFRAWTDHKLYDPGVEVDANRLPIKEKGLLEYVEEKGGAIHSWVGGSIQRAGLSLVDYADFLLWSSGIHSNPESPAARVAVIRSLTDPTSYAMNETDVRVQVEKALKAKGAVIADAQTPSGVRSEVVGAVTRRDVYRTLARLYPTAPTAMRIATDSGVSKGSVDWTGPMDTVWSIMLDEAAKSSRMKDLLSVVLSEYPSQKVLLAYLAQQS